MKALFVWGINISLISSARQEMCQEYILLTSKRYCNVFRELQMNFVNLSSLFLRRKRSTRFQSPFKCLIRVHENMSRISIHACFPVQCFLFQHWNFCRTSRRNNFREKDDFLSGWSFIKKSWLSRKLFLLLLCYRCNHSPKHNKNATILFNRFVSG